MTFLTCSKGLLHMACRGSAQGWKESVGRIKHNFSITILSVKETQFDLIRVSHCLLLRRLEILIGSREGDSLNPIKEVLTPGVDHSLSCEAKGQK